jgi:feruloyl esterase
VNLRDELLRKGFAFTQTNTGHDAEAEPLGTFAVTPQKLLDYAFRAVHVTAVTAKSMTARYYGSAAKKSYFVGCSTGGRQALIAAQRFPDDFDGILSMAPVLDFTGTMVNYARVLKAFETAPVPVAKLRLTGEKILALCDAKDGVTDGLIGDPRRCGFDPAADLPRCSGPEAPDCFTEGQIATLKTLYSDMSINGARVFPAGPLGAEVAGPDGRIGWENWLVREKGPPISQLFGTTFFQYLAYPTKDPNLRLNDFEPERDYPKLEAIRRILDATDPDLSGFRDRGGKLLMTFGWADPALNPNMGVEYYESVSRKMGSTTRDFFRLFMMPGVFHCAGGPGCDSAPRFAALIDWVESGKAPDVILAEKRVSGKVVRSRPLCQYPAVATYTSSGSTDDAANFRCVAPAGR